MLILLSLLLLGVYVQAGSSMPTVATHAINDQVAATTAHEQQPRQFAADPLPTRLGVCIGRSYGVVPAHGVPTSERVADAHLRCQML